MVLTQVNYYEKLQFMLFIIIMANYLRFSNTLPKQLEVFIRSSPVNFFLSAFALCEVREHPMFSINSRGNTTRDINHKVLYLWRKNGEQTEHMLVKQRSK